jgi:hypothetical protein
MQQWLGVAQEIEGQSSHLGQGEKQWHWTGLTPEASLGCLVSCMGMTKGALLVPDLPS